ncbi:hypothetical protein RFM99_26385 [Mesorhizobium sp. VK4C]|uniref:hypothetical protein n=1 Tax=Mesorhizobium captivum TaxID=3072319 RepID=UPI002A245726|nr:hypothetical protein [Mesorhizobium sp. VK4C]MDX8501928.1 hypothetical protein [Mesorhizobium sp. VK4C]
MTLAFRLYGKFRWPPAPTSVSEGSLPGVADIFFLPDGKKLRAALRWTYGKKAPSRKSPKLEEVEAVDPAKAVDFLGKGDADKTFWIDAQAKADWLAFRGAFLIEQYSEDKLDLRLPLANAFAYYKDFQVYSGLRLLKDGLFALRLNLPLSVEQSKLSNAPAFPLTARYKAATATLKDDPLVLAQLFGGWPDEIKDTLGTFAELTKHDGVSDFRLGGFGFSERGAGPAGFVSYQENTEKIGWHWPRNAKCFAQDLLARYGFDIGDDSWLTFGTGEPANLSLRFTRKDEVITGLTYRARVIRNLKEKPPKKGGDFFWEPQEPWEGGKPEVFKIRLGDELGGWRPEKIYYSTGKNDPVDGWLSIGGQVAADCEIAWDIDEDGIWSEDRGRDWLPTVALRLHWTEKVGATSAAGVEKDTLFAAALLGPANFAFDAARAAMPAGETGQPHSFVPTLTLVKPQTVRFTLYGSPIAARVDPGSGLLFWGRPSDEKGELTGPWKRPPMRLSLSSAGHLIAKTEDAPELALSAGNMSFFESGATRFDLTLSHDSKWPPTSVDSVEDGEPFFASFAAAVKKTPKSWRGRLASLEFQATESLDPKTSDELRGHLRIGGPGARDGYASGGPDLIYPQGRMSAEFRIVVPVSVIQPISVDVARFDRSGRAAPLLIPINGPKAGDGKKQGRYWLSATETLAARHDRQLSANIYENTPDAGENSDYAVLSSEPFSVFRFSHQPLANRGRDDTASVAVYSGDDRIWQYRTVSQYYHYVLPPQSIGESADKPRRLEIHDLVSPPADEIPNVVEGPPRPFEQVWKKNAKAEYILDGDGERIFDEAASSMRRRAVEQRLTPSAEIWISPSDVERGYFMPEATSYDIFRQAGAYGLGAALAFLRAEFLYGMPVGIDVAKEGGIARGARVAEIEALVGRLAGAARETDADRNLASRWNALRAAIARRPERLEIWARDTGSAVDFAPARFSDGVRFALRGTALHRPPLIDNTTGGDVAPESKEDNQAWPKVGNTIPDYKDKTETTAPGKPRHHPQGLSGGALWPVESINLFTILLEQPQSVGGTIEQIALSPQGGDAVQKAEFLGGKVAIISETRNGRVQRQQVEVIGRICALWHRAKHVVVYERTVNPSAQFAPKFEEDPDRTRSRRPILRKVREYIELLQQPERGYPDFNTATQRNAGFLERVRFNSDIINVDSAWSSEVGDFGWQIPLWNRQSARERPQVYPMPDVAFFSTAEGEGDKPRVAQDCLDTDMLFFFADFRAETSDTDQWKPRLGLDYANLPSAKAIADVFDVASSMQPEEDPTYGSDRRRRAVSRFLPGLRRFTWRLAPAAQKTAINAGRAGKPVYVGLDSVSFMRAGHVNYTHKTLTKELSDALKHSKEGLDLGTLPSLGYWSADGEGVSIDSAKKLSAMVGEKGSLIDVIHNSGDVAGAMAALSNLWTGKGDPSARDALAKIADGVDLKELTKFKSSITSGALCEKLKNDAVNMIQRKEMLISSALQDWVGEVDEKLAELQRLAESKPIDAAKFLGATKAEVIAILKQQAVDYIRPLFAEASQDVARIEEGVEKARAVLLDEEVEIDLIIARARLRVEQFNAGYEKDKPWSKDRRKAFRAGIEACIGSVADDIAAAIDEAAQRLATELNNASQSLAGHVAKFLKQVTVAEAEALGRLTNVGAAVDRLLTQVDGKLEDLQTKASDVVGRLPDIVKKVTDNKDLEDKAPELKKRLLDALVAAQKAVKDGHAGLAELRQRAQALDALVDSSIGGVEKAVKDVVDGLSSLGNLVIQATTACAQIAAELTDDFKDLKDEVHVLAAEVSQKINNLVGQVDSKLDGIGDEVDAVVLPAMRWLDATLVGANSELRRIPDKMLPIIDDIEGALQAVKDELAPDALLEGIVARLIENALAAILQPLPESIDPKNAEEVKKQILLARKRLQYVVEELAQRIREVGAGALGALDEVTAACKAVSQGVAEVEAYFEELAGGAQAYLTGKLGDAYAALDEAYKDFVAAKKDADELIDAVKDFDRKVRALHNDLGRLRESAEAYADRVFDAAGKLDDGGLLAAPNNILKLYSAVTSAPELAALKTDIDRIRSAFDELGDIIETTKANALFDRLSDELKAIGLSLPFDRIGDSLVPADLRNFNIGSVFRNFGGAKLDKLFKGYRIPDGVRDAVKVTHDFDKKHARAWVQVDINAPFPGRRSLFSLGIFKADFVDMQLTGRVRLEASKDQEKVSMTGFGRIGTAIDVVVAGQSMVRFEKFGLAFTKESGLDIEFDPKNVRLNPQFKFVQDFLSTIFPELPGGLEWIRENGIPVGVQHDFAIPNLSLNFATSGVSNISLENHFKLIAFPDFLLANRFNLSTMERPFIFSIFIIGGTGYIQVEAEYRPIRDELTVLVDAGAGGSAQLAFAFGPFTGQVFITLSGVLSYRKTIGKPGGGLSISVVLVIAGHVDVAGIVTVGVTLVLRMTYRDNGQIDADGSLSVTIRISQFFKLTARAQVKYKLRGGKSETSVTTSSSAELEGKAKEVENAAKKVQGAMK